MKKTIKQILSIVLCAVMVMTAVPLLGFLDLDLGVKASAYCYTVPEIETKLAQLASSGDTKVGSKWASGGCWRFVGRISSALYGVTIDSTQNSCQIELSCKNYYKVSPTLYNASSSDVVALLKKAQPGDVIGYRTTKASSWGHIAVVKAVSSSSITIYHAASGSVRQDTWKLNATDLPKGWGSGYFDNKSSGITLYRCRKVTSLANVVSMPAISTSNFQGGVYVSLSSATSGATIYYTTNGSTPTMSSTKYTGAFNLTSSATINAISVKSGMTTSGVASKFVTVNKTSTPKISSTMTNAAFSITITAENGAVIYYTTDGSAPNTSSTRYNGQFPLSSTATVKAIAVADGKAISDVAVSSISAKIPDTPVAKLEAPSNGVCGIGDEIRISWTQVANAAAYEIEINAVHSESESTSVTDTISQTGVYSSIALDSGEYTITVKAVNFLGKSAANSPAIKVSVKPNVMVTFTDYNGTVISEQSVKYDGNAVAPAAPSRTGYTFTSWKGSYNSVKKDTTVMATYTPNTYTVKFVDGNGSTLSSELVEYQQAVKTVPTAPSKTGYKFVAWSVKSGEGDSYEKVNGDVVFEPTYVWANPDMPLGITAKKAVRSSDATSYTVTVNIANSQSKVINGKLIAVIKTANDKVVATKIDVVSVPADASNYSQTIVVGGTAAGSVAEVYIVANDSVNDNRTGGAYSEKSAVAVTQESANTSSYWGDWSGWSTTHVASSSKKEVQSKTQYRYRDKQTTTSTSSSLSGWTPDGASAPWISSYGSWSDWQTASVSSSSTREVQTGALYRYYYYKCSKCGYRDAYCNRKCEKCGTYISSSDWHCVWSPMKYSDAYWYNYGTAGVKCYTYKIDGDRYFFSKGNANATAIGTIDACSSAQVIVTGYRYRTIYYSTTYYYYKWGNWSSWSDSAYYSSTTRQVDTQTVYRFRELLSKTTTSSTPYIGTEDTAGTVYNISGKLENITGDYSGKVAIIMVYKDKNIDPTEDQMQYVGQTTIGSGNSYSFSFIPKDPISTETGNYVVSFGIATADGLVNNVEIIEAPKPSYNVVFKDSGGNILKQQTVVSGEDAVPPVVDSMNGYDISWNRSFTNITRDTEITLISTPKTYNVIFVDWANDEIVDIKEAEHGTVITFPEDCSAVGKEFKGWSVPEGSIITDTVVVEAVYEDLMFTVNFLNHDGTVYEERKVSYGATATFPEENPVEEGYEFITWSNETEWWNVTEDMDISPVFIFDQTVEAPMSNADDTIQLGSANVDFETSTEDATIRYTTDGTEPTEESVVFDDTIWIEETTTFKVKAFKAGMNASATVETTFEVIPEEEYDSALPKVTAVTSGSYYEVGSENAKLCMRIDNPSEFTIKSWGYLIEDLYTNETSDYINTEIAGMTDVTVGRVFNISGLSSSTNYSYVFYVEFDEVGLIESDMYEFTTLSNSGNVEPNPGPDPEVPIPVITIKNPSATTINYKSGIILHANASNIPAGGRVKWEADNSNFIVTDNGDGTCKIISNASGDTTFTATVVDSNGNTVKDANGNIVKSEIKMTSNAGFFQKIIAFFKGLFGLNKILPQMFWN